MALRLENTQITNAGWRQVGHYGRGYLALEFLNGRVEINPQSQHIDDMFSNVFDVDTENGVWFEMLRGRYCRLIIDENNEIVGLQHIVSSGWVDIDDLKKAGGKQ